VFSRAAATLLLLFIVSTALPQAQENATAPAADEAYTQIPKWGAAGEQKLEAGDPRGAIAEFRKAFEAARELRRQYPDEPAYTENAYFYLGRLGVAFAAAGDYENAAAMMDPSARGYVGFASEFPTPENREKAAIALGQLAWYQVLTGKGADAARNARQALELDPSLTVVRVNLAHALLVDGREGEAEALYLKDRDAVAEDGRPFRDIILEDFDAMEKAGISNATITRVRQALGDSPERAESRRAGQNRSGTSTSIWGWLFVGGVIAFIAGVFVAIIYFDRKRTAKLEAAARELGFAFRRKPTPEDKALPGGSALTTLGRGQTIRNIIELPEREGARCTLFDFTYIVGHGKNSKTYTQTVARIQSPRLQLPKFDLRPEGLLSKIAQSFGYRDIDFEGWPEFSRRYQLRSEDEAGVRRLFTTELLQHCEKNRGLWVSGGGDLLFIHRERQRVKPENITAFVASALETATFFLNPGSNTPPPAAPPPLPPPPLPT
jgi:tetratricopeptide (TPR) repeat protein